MKKVIIVRHGDYDGNHRLSPTGENQMKKLAQLIEPHLLPNTIFLSSTAPRADDSSRVLATALKLKYKSFPELHSGNDSPVGQDNQRAINLINDEAKKNQADCVIVLTHLEYASVLPYKFRADNYRSINKGQGLIIDFEHNSTAFVSGLSF